jgi:hypothetical protein
VVLLASLCAAAIAQERDEDERAGNRVVYATPSKELARLKPMVGTWRSDETWREPVRWKRGEYEGVPGPEGYVTRTVEPGPGELSFRFSEEGRGPMGSVQAAGLVSWDPVRRVYVLDSVSSVFPGIVRLTGAFHGADLVLSGEDTGTGRRRAVRLVLKDPGADGWTETLSEKAEGRWAEVVTRRFRRAPAARDPSSPVPP